MSWTSADTLPRTVTFAEVLHDCATDVSHVPESGGLDRSVALQLARGINAAYRYAWEYYDWPDARSLESLPVSAHPVNGGAFLPRQTAAGLRIAVVYGMWTTHPLADPLNTCKICWRMGPDGFYLQDFTLADEVDPEIPPEDELEPLPEPVDPAEAWVDYRPDCPRFTSEAWDDTVTYAAGQLVYDAASGHCYRAIASSLDAAPAENADKWTPLPLLYILAEAVKAGAVAMFHRSEGQHGTAQLLEGAMMHLLDAQIIQLDNQNGQTRQYRHGR